MWTTSYVGSKSGYQHFIELKGNLGSAASFVQNQRLPYKLVDVILRAWFVRHRHYLERTKTFVLGFVFVFVWAHEPAKSSVASYLFQTLLRFQRDAVFPIP